MATHLMSTLTPRIGAMRAEFLKAAIPQMTIGVSGDQKEMQQNESDTQIYRSWLPIGATAASPNTWSITPTDFEAQEGVTPNARTMNSRDVTVTMKQYIILYGFSDKLARLYEDKIPPQMKIQTGQAIGLLKEKIQLATLRSGTNQFYAGGTSRGTVSRPINLNMVRAMSKSITNNRGMRVTSVLKASAIYGSQAVEAGFLVFCHTSMDSDIRDLPGFKDVVNYAGKPVHPKEVGSCEGFRFITSPEIDYFIDSGAAVAATGLETTGGSLIDVYQFFVIGQDAWADVALRGLAAIEEIDVPYDKQDKADPGGQRGYIGGKFYAASFIQNEYWLAIGNCGITLLSA